MQSYIKAVFWVIFSLMAQQAFAVIAITKVIHNDMENPPHCSGAITVTAEGNAGPFTFLWSTGSTTSGIHSLCAGVYTVTVTNAFGCTKVLSAQIYNCNSFPSFPIEITNAQITPLSGANTNDGAINLTVAYGAGTRYFKWTKQGSNTVIATTEDISNLSAGTYCVEITGDCYGGTSACYTILNCGTVEWNITPTVKNDCNCSGCTICWNGCQDGSISLAVTNPSGPKSYKWNTGATSPNLTGLSAGTYTVTITLPSSGCSTVRTFTITTVNVVETQINGCAWKATCDGNKIAEYYGETEQRLELKEIEGHLRCVRQQYCEGVPVPNTYAVIGNPQKVIDEDFCKGQLVCSDGFNSKVVKTIFGETETISEGLNCHASVRCTIPWPEGPPSVIEMENTIDYTNTAICAYNNPGDNGWTVVRLCLEEVEATLVETLGTFYDTSDPAYQDILEEYGPIIPNCAGYGYGGGLTDDPSDRAFMASQTSQTGGKIKVFPNPFKDYLIVYYFDQKIDNQLNITVFDMLGKEVYSQKHRANEENGAFRLHFDTTLKPGVYQLLVTGDTADAIYKANLVHIER